VLAHELARADETLELASLYLDPPLVDMLSIIGFDRHFVSSEPPPANDKPIRRDDSCAIAMFSHILILAEEQAPSDRERRPARLSARRSL
jgi:hypothetical protein